MDIAIAIELAQFANNIHSTECLRQGQIETQDLDD